jgi:uncharacterized membrane protein
MKLEMFKRFNIILGFISTLLWITLVFFVSNAFRKMSSKAWILFIGGVIICCAIPYLFFKWVQWLIKRNNFL